MKNIVVAFAIFLAPLAYAATPASQPATATAPAKVYTSVADVLKDAPKDFVADKANGATTQLQDQALVKWFNDTHGGESLQITGTFDGVYNAGNSGVAKFTGASAKALNKTKVDVAIVTNFSTDGINFFLKSKKNDKVQITGTISSLEIITFTSIRITLKDAKFK